MGLSSKQVSGDGLDWSQQIGDNGVEIPKPIVQARNQQQRIQCPRCDSSNTKFCYYNNYSRSQPRHFCRACRRHWTAGGTLRNVPVGGGRKNKRPKITTTTNCDYGQQVPEPFSSVGELEGSVFPDVYYQLLLYPPPISSDQFDSNSSMTSLLSPPPPPLLPEFAATRSAAMASTDEAVVINPSPMSVPEKILLSTTTTACPWLQDPPPLPASYCWNWWDDTTDLVGSATADGA